MSLNHSINSRKTRKAGPESVGLPSEYLDPARIEATIGARIVIITPEVAQVIMDNINDMNRHCGEALARSYGKSMADGYWEINGETLVFGDNGKLLDGQHRLMGCILFNVPFSTWAVFGVDHRAFDTIDRGKKRSTADDLSIEGEKNVNVLASTLALIWLEETGQLRSIGLTPPSIVARDVLRRHPEVRDSVSGIHGLKKKHILHPRIAAFCHYRFHQISPEKAEKFFAGLETGINLGPGSPILALRRRLIDDRDAKAKLKAVEVLALVIKAWNSHVKNSIVGQSGLRWLSVEPFPTIGGK